MPIMKLDRPYMHRMERSKEILREIAAYIASTTLLMVLVLGCALLLHLAGDLGGWGELPDQVPDRIVAL
jgi:hypothetical protein